MRHSKKLTRTQRNLLIKAGYKKDLHNLYYIMDKGNELLFIDEDCNKVLYNKSSKTVTEVAQGGIDMSRSKERKSLYALRHLIVKAGFNYKEAKQNKNFEVISIGVELGFLTESDIKFMLDKNTSEIMAGNRLIRRRHEYYGES